MFVCIRVCVCVLAVEPLLPRERMRAPREPKTKKQAQKATTKNVFAAITSHYVCVRVCVPLSESEWESVSERAYAKINNTNTGCDDYDSDVDVGATLRYCCVRACVRVATKKGSKK